MTLEWLEHCADLFKNDSQAFSDKRGFKLLDDKSLITSGKERKK